MPTVRSSYRQYCSPTAGSPTAGSPTAGLPTAGLPLVRYETGSPMVRVSLQPTLVNSIMDGSVSLGPESTELICGQRVEVCVPPTKIDAADDSELICGQTTNGKIAEPSDCQSALLQQNKYRWLHRYESKSFQLHFQQEKFLVE